jgi:hypothetical protein
MRVPMQETGLFTSFTAPERRGRGRGVTPSCTCTAAGAVATNNCGPKYNPQCNWNQATASYSCVCV